MIKHKEVHGSQEGQDATSRRSTAELAFYLRGSNSLSAMRTYYEDNSLFPELFDGLVLDAISREQVENRVWRWSGRYVEADEADKNFKLATGEILVSFDTTGGSVKLTTSLHTTRYAKSGQTATDHHGAINVQQDGSVEGVERTVPLLKFTIKKRMPRATITTSYIKTLARLTGTTNLVERWDFEDEELLFMGATGQQGTHSDPEILFHFGASENAEDLTIGEIAEIAKKGHEYLWVQFEAVSDVAAKSLARRPKAVYVERLYMPADWDSLEI